ncbi:protein FAM43B [Chiloscyllium punctatum]|uniref:PID domain-containing protein n=1 Tax=Chiloscyllium punctatum TaxID=137246 RepID=A0A401THG0_CHIPU|nr:hypothetical protein [Chiloscyllium punctatum]
MLPWRKSKLVLLDEENQAKAKSLPGGGLSYSSLLSSLVRACPGIWPQCPLPRLGNMFRSRRQKLQLTRDAPSYTVWYLGNAVTFTARGEGCTEQAVARIWARCEQGTAGTKMKLTIGPHGIRMRQAEYKCKQIGHLYLLHRITYCAADGQRRRVLAWVYRHQVKHKAVVLRCHAVLLCKAARAQELAAQLQQLSRSAFADFKRLKRQDDARHRQQQRLGQGMVPLVPIRKLLNSQCPYRPPLERARSGLRLMPIAEDVAGEEQEERGLEPGTDSGITNVCHQLSSWHIDPSLHQPPRLYPLPLGQALGTARERVD